MHFQIVGDISHIETFAAASAIREVARLRKFYGRGRWRKRKGIARVRLEDGTVRLAEVHWHEAHGIGRKEFKIKRYTSSLLLSFLNPFAAPSWLPFNSAAHTNARPAPRHIKQ